MSLLGKLSSFKKKQPVPSLSTSTDDLMVELEDGLKIDLSYPLNSDFREKYFEDPNIPTIYSAGFDDEDKEDKLILKQEYAGQKIIIEALSNERIFRNYINEKFNLQNKNFKYYYLTNDEFNEMIMENEDLDNAIVNYIKNKDQSSTIKPLYAFYQKNAPQKLKELRKIRNDAINSYVDEKKESKQQVKPISYKQDKYSSDYKSNDNSENSMSISDLSGSRIAILMITMIVIILIINISGKPCSSYGLRLASFLIQVVVVYGSFKLISKLLFNMQKNDMIISSINESQNNRFSKTAEPRKRANTISPNKVELSAPKSRGDLATSRIESRSRGESATSHVESRSRANSGTRSVLKPPRSIA